MATKTVVKPAGKRRFSDEDPASYKEPAPMNGKHVTNGVAHPHESPLESMMRRFDKAQEILNLEPGIYQYLKTPVKSVIVSVPIVRDDGSESRQTFAELSERSNRVANARARRRR